jgi:hypothetical protein
MSQKHRSFVIELSISQEKNIGILLVMRFLTTQRGRSQFPLLFYASGEVASGCQGGDPKGACRFQPGFQQMIHIRCKRCAGLHVNQQPVGI